MKEIKLKEFLVDIGDIVESSLDRKFCFILGAGASRSSNIPTGSELAEKWFEEIKIRLNQYQFEEWIEVEQINVVELGSFYGKIFSKRFERDRRAAYDFLYNSMADSSPSLGYTILAQILAEQPHNVVITTNFDTLIEQSIYSFTSKRPLIIGHEVLSQFARPYSDRPLIIKIHRDLFFNPFNSDNELKQIARNWEDSLAAIFNRYIPIVIGYAGNDGSLMDYLTRIRLNDKLFWCYKKGGRPSQRVIDLLENHSESYLVEINGFDDLMYELMFKLNLKLVDGKLKEKHQITMDRYQIQMLEIIQRKAANENQEKAEVNSMLRKKFDSYILQIIMTVSLETDNTKKLELLIPAVEKNPDNLWLLVSYAECLCADNRIEEGEKIFNSVISQEISNPFLLKSIGDFYNNYKNDFILANNYYLEALKIMPDQPYFLVAYAKFQYLKLERNEMSDATFKTAIKYSIEAPYVFFEYASFQMQKLKDYDSSLINIKKAIELDPDNVNYKIACYLCLVAAQKEEANSFYQKLSDFEKEQIYNLDDSDIFFLSTDNYLKFKQKIEESIRKKHNLVSSYLKLTYYYACIERKYTSAKDTFDLFLKLNKQPGSETDKLFLGIIYYHFQDGIKSKEILNELIKSNDVAMVSAAYNQLGIIYKNLFADFNNAERSYLEALNNAVIPKAINYANFADLYFYFENTARGEEMLNKAFEVSSLEKDNICLWFYRYIYLDEKYESMEQINRLLEKGIRNSTWEFQYNIKKLEEQKHPDIKKIKMLADKINEFK
jgi:tetratricopeptide (TPR) repeat protein